MDLSRRKLIGSTVALLCTPAIVRASSLMPVKALPRIGYMSYIEWLAQVDFTDHTRVKMLRRIARNQRAADDGYGMFRMLDVYQVEIRRGETPIGFMPKLPVLGADYAIVDSPAPVFPLSARILTEGSIP